MKASFVCWLIQVGHDIAAYVSVTAASDGAAIDDAPLHLHCLCLCLTCWVSHRCFCHCHGASATESAAVSFTKSEYFHPLALEWLGNLWLLRARLPNRVGCRTECRVAN